MPTSAVTMGVLGAAFGIGFVIGPMIGGILGHFNTSLPAYAAMLMSGGAAYMTYLRLPETRANQSVGEEAWLHPSKFAPLFKKPVLIQLMFIGFFSMMAFVMMESTSSLFLSATLGWNALKIGLYFCYLGFIIALVQGGMIGRLTKKHGEWPLAVTGPLLVTVGMIAYCSVGFTASISLLFVAGLFNAAGRSFQGPTTSSLISKNSDANEQGAVFGFFNGILSLARVAGPLIAAPAYLHLRHTGQFLVAGVITAVCAVWTMVLRRKAMGIGAATATVAA